MLFIEFLAVNIIKRVGRCINWQELQRAYTIAPNGREQAVSIGAASLHFCRNAFPDFDIVGKQIVKYRNDGRTDVAIFAQLQGERYGHGMFPCEPAFAILKIYCARFLAP